MTALWYCILLIYSPGASTAVTTKLPMQYGPYATRQQCEDQANFYNRKDGQTIWFDTSSHKKPDRLVAICQAKMPDGTAIFIQ